MPRPRKCRRICALPRHTSFAPLEGDGGGPVEMAVEEYAAWQCGKLGRDINPSKLVALLMQTGIKRVEVVSPTYQALRDGQDNTVPQVASLDGKTVTNGGMEDE